MYALSIFIFALALHGFADCKSPPLSPESHGLISLSKRATNEGGSNLGAAIASCLSELQRILPVNQILSASLPRMLIRRIAESVYSQLDNVQSSIMALIDAYNRSIIGVIRSEFDNAIGLARKGIPEFLRVVDNWPQIASQQGSARSRRSIITSPIEGVTHIAQTTMEAMWNQIESIISRIIEAAWKFMTSRGLPWLHTVLDDIEASNVLPEPAQTLIRNFDALYSMIQLLGLVGS